VSAGLGAGVVTGLGPKAALIVELGGALFGDTLGAGARLGYLPQSESRTQGDRGLRLWSVGGAIEASYLAAEWLRLDLGISGYRMSATGIGISDPASDVVWSFAPEVGIGVVPWRPRPLALEVGLLGRVGLNRPRFELSPSEPVYQTPRFGLAALFRLKWSSP
jgi:hypothetical protein